MKFYVHYEDQPGYTVVYRASPGDRNATVWSLVCWFASKYNSTHTAEKSIDPKFLTVSSGIARRELEADSLLRKSLADHSDVFVSARQRPDTPLTGQTTYNDNSFRCVDEELPAAPNHGGVGADTRHAVGAGSATEARPPEAAEVAEASAMAERLLNAAERAEASKNLRHAVSILEQLLALLPQRARPALACLSRLSRLWLSAGRPREALLHARDAAARFPGEEAPQVLLGDCLSHAGARKAELSEALGCYEAALGRRGGPASGAPDLLLARARTLHRLSSGDPAAAAAAGSLVMEVLAADQQNWDGLLLYAQIAASRGMTEDAIRVLLRLLVDRPKSKEVRRSLAEAVSKPGMLDAMVSELTGEAYTAAALAFLATCVKDHGAIEAAIELFRRADSLSPCPSYALNLIHTEELLLQFERCIEDVRRFCERSPDILSVASVSLADVAEELEGLARADSAVSVWQSAGALSDGRPDGELPSPSIEVEYSSDELDAIAVVMTAAKVLFVGGALSAADGVVRRIEPAVAASVKPLHTTLIRNEAAYLGCVKQILRGPHRPADPGASSLRPLFLAGDSHSLSGAWQQVSLRGEQRVLVPKLVTGCKIWHTRPESVFYPKAGFESTMASIPDGSQVVMLFGEIDCREGLLLAVEKCKYDSLEEAIAATVHIYLEALRRLLGRGMEIFVHPLPPVLNETRHIVLPFNAALRRAVDEAARDPSAGGRLHWLDFLDELLTPDGKRLNPALEFDGTHLSPAYVRHLDAALGAVP